MNILSKHSHYNTTDIILVVLLCLTMLDWNGFGYYAFYAPLVIFIFKGGIQLVDKNFVLLLLFGLTYSLFDLINYGSLGYAYNIQPIVNFPMMYLMGKYLGAKNDESGAVNSLLLFAISLAILTILSVSRSYITDGFAIVGRDIELIGYSNDIGQAEFLYTATGLYSKVMPLTLFICFLLISTSSRAKWIYIVSAVIAFVCCLRLQSRSSIYILFAAVIVPLIFGGKSNIKSQIFGLFLLVASFCFVISQFSDQLIIIDRFQNNGEFGNEGEDGRLDLAKKFLSMLSNHLFGGLRNERYAHNLWLDSARIGGVIPLFILLVITKRWAAITFYIFKNKLFSHIFKLFILNTSICLFLYFNTEPIIEGAAMLFSYFCIYFGIITSQFESKKISL